MSIKTTTALFVTILSSVASAQDQSVDTVIVPLAKTSKIIFTIQDRSDLDILRHYNFQDLFQDILQRIEESDSLRTDSTENEILVRKDTENEEGRNTASSEEYREDNGDDEDDDDDDFKWEESRRGRVGQTLQSTNVDLGTNNFLAGGQFPDGGELYAVRPWGSWYLGVNSVQRTKLGRNVFVEWGIGVSWYSFKFQADNALIQKDELNVQFLPDTRDVDFIKSKLSATFINASLVPVLDFGDHSRKQRMWDRHGDGFRLGVGPYVGYRLSSKTKMVYKEDGHREKDKNRDNFYLNNLRYGFRVQIGVRSTDLFINYDMNELFAKDKGPKLNAISFGLIF